MLIGIISDTHGLLPVPVLDAFAGVSHILHAGDVGDSSVIERLETIAPVTAVRGNTDRGELKQRLADSELVELAGHGVLLAHSRGMLADLGLPEGVDVVVTGHTHRASVEHRAGVLYLNPGSAGAPGRDGRGPSVAVLDCSGDDPVAQIIRL
jgi:hypothetical protein